MNSEIWKDIEESNNHEISTLGRLRNKTTGKISVGKLDKDGYIEFCICNKSKVKYRRSHRLVAKAFIPNPENKEQVNHINGIKTDNRVENLEWVNCSENITHAFKIGLKTQRGSKNNGSKLTEEQVLEIKKLLKLGELSGYDIARKFNLHPQYVSLIKAGRRWGWLEENNV